MADTRPRLGATVPVLRSFDEALSRAFYIDFLGFEVEFEHRFADNTPLYMGLKLGDCRLHITEHFGDACPGAQVRIATGDVVSYMRTLSAKRYKHANPGNQFEPTPWGTIEVTITDPSGNKLTFVQED